MLRSQCPERKYGKEEEAGERQYDANPKALPDHRNKNYACVDQTIERQEERDNPRNRYLALESHQRENCYHSGTAGRNPI
jgi:hypothetical protein